MLNTDVQPALSPEEWKRFAVDRAALTVERFRDLFEGRPTRNEVVRIKGDYVQLIEPNEAHALAALSLYGQPFGFTHDDVQLLIWANHALDDEGVETATCLKFAELAARIAALLPPG